MPEPPDEGEMRLLAEHPPLGTATLVGKLGWPEYEEAAEALESTGLFSEVIASHALRQTPPTDWMIQDDTGIWGSELRIPGVREILFVLTLGLWPLEHPVRCDLKVDVRRTGADRPAILVERTIHWTRVTGWAGLLLQFVPGWTGALSPWDGVPTPLAERVAVEIARARLSPSGP